MKENDRYGKVGFLADPTYQRTLSRIVAIAAIALLASLLAAAAAHLPPVRSAVMANDESLYDAVYKLRPIQVQTDSPVVLLEIDDASLQEVDKLGDFRWPWPREFWARMAGRLQQAGAKAVVFDLILTEKSVYEDDDQIAAARLDALKRPVVFGVVGIDGRFALPSRNAVVLGDVELNEGKIWRAYSPTTPRGDSLALAAVRVAGEEPKLPLDQPFLLHYYGPHRAPNRDGVLPAYRASRLALASMSENEPLERFIDPKLFRDKIVVIGSTAAGLADVKQTPLARQYPGAAVHATAILNLIRGERVGVMPAAGVTALSFLAAVVVSAGVVFLRQAAFKLLAIAAVVLALLGAAALGMGALGMQAKAMVWFAPTEPLLATILACVGGLIWVYKIEDARSRFLLRALRQCIAPEVAEELARDPSKLSVGGRRRQMTILFSDLQGFTDLTERLGEKIEPVLNLYLAEMGQEAFNFQGTIDKFIGDAMMVFWNAPLDQAHHARRACEAALALREQERRIASRMQDLGAEHVFTRIGIHTGPVVVGFFGSRERLTYTAIGDSVNLAARLEPSNKIYGTQILVSRDTVEACGDSMLFRPIDRLRVYGRKEPVGVYELIAARATATEAQSRLAAESMEAAQAYLNRDWAGCLRRVEGILAQFPEDGPARMWRGRVTAYLKNPPSEDWDGVYEQTMK